ncbi:MAG: RidA family protein [Hymenobacteraceae bacterium]|nr:RidA family protein [Hymenobacteraceae bacterium]
MSTETSASAFHSGRAPEPVGAYPHARRVGNLLFLSGVGPRQRGSAEIPGVGVGPDGQPCTTDFAAQCRATFANVRAILEESGSAWSQLVDVTVYLTDMGADFATYNRLWAEAFPDPHTQPCRTTVEINRLPTPIAIELKCMATVG